MDNIEKVDFDNYKSFIISFINNLPIPIFIKDTSGVYISINYEFEKLFGFEKDFVLGKTVFDIAPEKIAQTYHNKDLELLKNPKDPQIYDYVIKNKKTEELHNVRFHKNILFDKNGNTIGLLGLVMDMTSNIRNQKKLENFIKVFDEQVIASRTNLNGQITYASKAFQKISGYSEDELLGKNHNIVRHKDMESEFFKNLWDTIKKEETWQGEMKNVKKNGEVYWVNATIKPHYENGKLVEYSAVRTDITDKKKLIELKDSLEEKVQQRTRKLLEQLYTDDLTGLKNNRALLKDLEQADKVFVTMFLINIDNFDNINSVFGYKVGNKVLKKFATFLDDFNKNKGYKLFRIYADEFALLKDFDFINIEKCNNDLLELKKEINSFKYSLKDIDDVIQIDVSIGMSFAQENPLATSTMALKYAKQHKLGFQVYNSEIDSKSKFEYSMKWKKKIKKSIDNNLVIPVFQPIVNKNKEVIKYEVLARIEVEEEGKIKRISPAVFMDEAIKSKLYTKLMIQMFTKTFDIMCKENKSFSINLSYNDIFNKSIIDFIEKSLEEKPKLASKLTIEILETYQINNIQIMDEFLEKFRGLGVKIAIDDFGMGHSNLSHILHIQPDIIKIDGIFIKNINTDKKSKALVKSVLTIAKELDIVVTAEFVHSKEVFDELLKLGIDEYQGFYFSEPLDKVIK